MFARARRPSRAQLQEERAKSASIAVASLLFLTLVAAALPFGPAAVGPLLRSAFAARDPKPIGDIVYTMPDRVFCRHMSFDNATAEVTEGPLERCPDNIAGSRPFAVPKFAWGAH